MVLVEVEQTVCNDYATSADLFRLYAMFQQIYVRKQRMILESQAILRSKMVYLQTFAALSYVLSVPTCSRSSYKSDVKTVSFYPEVACSFPLCILSFVFSIPQPPSSGTKHSLWNFAPHIFSLIPSYIIAFRASDWCFFGPARCARNVAFRRPFLHTSLRSI